MYDTLEEAQARIVELDEQIKTVSADRDTLSEQNNSLTSEIENLRTINQIYFNKLQAQDDSSAPEKEEDEPDVPSCEDFAKTIKI